MGNLQSMLLQGLLLKEIDRLAWQTDVDYAAHLSDASIWTPAEALEARASWFPNLSAAEVSPILLAADQVS